MRVSLKCLLKENKSATIAGSTAVRDIQIRRLTIRCILPRRELERGTLEIQFKKSFQKLTSTEVAVFACRNEES